MKLQKGKLQKWHGFLSKVVDEFVKSAKGKPSLEFWDTVAHHHGSEMCGVSPTLSGWVTVFASFNADGEWQGNWNYEGNGGWPRIDSDKIPEGVVSVPVNIDDNRVHYDGTMVAGQMVFSVVGDNLDTVQPRNDWCLAIKEKSRFSLGWEKTADL